MPPAFGHIAGQVVGSTYKDRRELSSQGMHTPTVQGISGNGTIGAHSIVASGGYEDDEDHGDYLIYTGMGGRDPATGRQVADQRIDHYANAALIRSEITGVPVRVVRGASGDNKYAPSTGLRYDGLFQVTSHWMAIGVHGFRVVRFRIDRLPGQSEPAGLPPVESDASYSETTIVRRIRNSKLAQLVKELHQNKCQICGIAVSVAGGSYSEGAHIRPLGRPHVGPDLIENILCLCPNHHVQLDLGGIVITDALEVVERESGIKLGDLRTHKKHVINPVHLAYQRGMWPTIIA